MEKRKTAEELLKGAYDLHIHSSPSHFPRLIDDFELVKQAYDAKMAGVMLKSHYDPTGARAVLVNERLNFKCTKAYGGVALNYPVGGLNPFAVESSLKMGGTFVWMPTRDAANSLISGDMPGDFFKRDGIYILDENDNLLPVLYEIMDIVKKYNGVLATGHISPKESLVLCREALKNNVKIVLTHPEFSRTVVAPSIQKELGDQGVFIEKCWYNIAANECTAKSMAETINMVGANNCFMSTDRGQKNLESPVEGMKLFIKTMQNKGLSDEKIKLMISDVPKKILNI